MYTKFPQKYINLLNLKVIFIGTIYRNKLFLHLKKAFFEKMQYDATSGDY